MDEVKVTKSVTRYAVSGTVITVIAVHEDGSKATFKHRTTQTGIKADARWMEEQARANLADLRSEA